MMTSLQQQTSTSAKPVISGDITLAAGYLDFLEDIDSHIQTTLDNISHEESVSFRNRLNETPNWTHTQENGAVTLSRDAVRVSVGHDDAQDLEYGNPLDNKAASGLIRSQAKRLSDTVGNSLVDRIVEEGMNA